MCIEKKINNRPQPKLVSVIVINYNKKDYLVKCLNSVINQTYKNIEIIVVDNGSSDGSQRLIKESYPTIKLIENEANDYFNVCRARNQGVMVAKGEYVLSLDNDVTLETNFIDEMVEVAELDSSIGMVGGKILLMDKKTIYSTALFPNRARRATERGNGEEDRGQYGNPCYIFGPTGAVSFFKREMLGDVKINGEYFDETYPWGYDDLDICWRAHLFGWNGFYTPKAVACHVRGGTIKTERPKLRFLKKYYFTQLPHFAKVNMIRGRYATIIKNDSLKDIIINLPYLLLYEFKLWSYIFFIEPKLILDIIRGIKYIKFTLRKRKIIQKKKIKKVFQVI